MRQKLIDTWMVTGGSMEDKKDAMDSCLEHNGFEERFKYSTYYEQMNPIIQSISTINEDDLVRRELALIKRRKKINKMSKFVNDKMEDVATGELILDSFMQAVKEHEAFEPIVWHNNVSFESNGLKTVYLSDIHFMEGDGARVEEIFEDISCQLEENEKVRLIFTGDLIQGCLRESDMISGNLRIDKQITQLADVIIGCVATYLFESISEIILIPGNHDRINITKQYDENTPTVVTMLHSILTYALPNVDIILTQEYRYRDYIVIHGDQFKGKKAIQNYYRDMPQQIVHAHYHHHYVEGNCMGLPSLSEPNAYERSLGIEDNEPAYMIEKDGYWKKILL